MKQKIKIEKLKISFESKQALSLPSFEIFENEILTIIGPANSGKSTLLRAINRLHDINPLAKVEGRVLIDGQNIYESYERIFDLRKRVGMIFATPVPLPLSIFDNVAYGPQLHGINDQARLMDLCEKSLRSAGLWEEVRDRLDASALCLSGGQQQRLCLARALAVEPEIIMFDEPCSGLDPISTAKVEASLLELKKKYTIILVTNNTKQAARVGDRTAFFLQGELVEVDATQKIFTAPADQRTNDYITGRFG